MTGIEASPSLVISAQLAKSPAKFALLRAVLGSNSLLPIDSERYKAIKKSRDVIAESLVLEQKFELVVANLLEFEQTLDIYAADHMLRHHSDTLTFQDHSLTINRRVHNVLSASRGYLDQGAHHVGLLKALLEEIPIPFREESARQYDAKPMYRVAEALRNFTQHQGFAISNLRIGGTRIETTESESILRYTIHAYVDIDALADGASTKAEVAEWLRAHPDEIDARPLLREYVAALAIIHEGVRSATDKTIAEHEANFLGCIEDFRKQFPSESSMAGLAAVRLTSEVTWEEEIYISGTIVERRRTLHNRNRNLRHLAHWHVSSEPSPQPPQKRKPRRKSSAK
jgi:hypothetical protein